MAPRLIPRALLKRHPGLHKGLPPRFHVSVCWALWGVCKGGPVGDAQGGFVHNGPLPRRPRSLLVLWRVWYTHVLRSHMLRASCVSRCSSSSRDWVSAARCAAAATAIGRVVYAGVHEAILLSIEY